MASIVFHRIITFNRIELGEIFISLYFPMVSNNFPRMILFTRWNELMLDKEILSSGVENSTMGGGGRECPSLKTLALRKL